MKNLDLSVSSILCFKMFYNFRMEKIIWGEFPDPRMFIRSSNDPSQDVQLGVQVCSGDSGLSDL